MLAALPAIASIGSGLLNFFGGQSAQDKAIAAQQQVNEQNWQHSLAMAQNSIQWRAEDAEKAGINKLYAIGAPTMSFAPAQVGAAGVPYNAMKPLADTLHGLGQDVSRAGYAGQSQAAKVAGAEASQRLVSNNLDLQSKGTDNEIKQMQLALLKARYANLTGTPPVGPFNVPESNKSEGRPPLMMWGTRIRTNPNTSNAQAYEDRYGDDGPMSWLYSTGIGLADAYHHFFPPMGSGQSTLDRTRAAHKWYNLERDPNFTMGY